MIRRRSPEVPDTLPPWLQHVLQQCFSFDTASRPSVAQLHQVCQAASPCIFLFKLAHQAAFTIYLFPPQFDIESAVCPVCMTAVGLCSVHVVDFERSLALSASLFCKHTADY